MSKQDFPLSQHPNGQWYKQVNKKRYYFGKWADDAKGERAIKQWMERKDGIHAGTDSIRVAVVTTQWTVGQLAEAFKDMKAAAVQAGDLSPETLRDYRNELTWFEKAAGKDTVVAALRPEHFAKIGRLMLSERKLGRHARRRVIAYIKAMFNWGAENSHFPAPSYGTDFSAPDTSPSAIRQAKARAGVKDYSGRIVTGQEIDKLIAAATAQYPAIILLGVNCGLGPADIGRLRWSHVDLETGLLNMPRGKTGNERRGYLWKRTRKALVRTAKLKYAQAGPDGLVFVTRKGKPMYEETPAGPKQAISQVMAKVIKRAGLDKQGLTHYRLRHTFKTLGKRAKDRDALNLMMGHKEGTTGEVYDHEEIDFARIKRVSIKVKAALWPKPKKKAGDVPAPSMRMVA